MSKNVKGRLNFLFAGVILLLLLYTVLALAVPFEQRFTGGYWVAFGGAFANAVAAIMFLLVPLNTDAYGNDACANKLSLVSCCMVVLGDVIGIIFAAVAAEIWVAVIVVAVEFVLALLVGFYFLTTSKSEAEAE